MLSLLKKLLFNNIMVASYLLIIATIVFVSLASYNSADPSFSLATDRLPQNLAGLPGSYLADFLLLSLGIISAGLLPLILISWSFILYFRKSLSFWFLRVLSAIIAVISLSLFFNSISNNFNITNYGGIITQLLLSNQSDGRMLYYYFTGFGVVSIISLLFALGYSLKDYINILKLSANCFRKLISYLSYITSLILHGIKIPFLALFTKIKLGFTNSTERLEPKIRDASLDKTLNKKSTGVFEPAIIPENKLHQQEIHITTKKMKEPDGFELPPLDLFNQTSNTISKQESPDQLKKNASELLSVLNDFGIKGQIIEVNQGPVVTLYEFEPSAGTKSSRVIGLADDIARTLSALSTRIAVIPGRNVLGIELPNKHRSIFYLKELIDTAAYNNRDLKLPIILGKDLGGKPFIADLARMPHLLVAGTTGSGKSVAINVMILSLLYRHAPDNCKFIMIDPKMLELSAYDGIPHLLTPVVTEPPKAVVALKWAVREMENRYRLMSNLNVRNIDGYNAKIIEALKNNQKLERTVQTGFDPETGKPIYEYVPITLEKLPYIVIIVDEMADLMLVAGKDIESSIQRLAQMARAAGIHLIMATQRPSVDVITGVIKANFPSRISFKVTSKIDSRTILGEQGAEQLLGQGDMLYMGTASMINRVHCPFVADAEVERIASYLKTQASPEYVTAVTEATEDDVSDILNIGGEGGSEEDLYRQAILIIKRDKKVSTSYIQRALRIGYNRAANLIERMERDGIISPANHAGKREILVPED